MTELLLTVGFLIWEISSIYREKALIFNLEGYCLLLLSCNFKGARRESNI